GRENAQDRAGPLRRGSGGLRLAWRARTRLRGSWTARRGRRYRLKENYPPGRVQPVVEVEVDIILDLQPLLPLLQHPGEVETPKDLVARLLDNPGLAGAHGADL